MVDQNHLYTLHHTYTGEGCAHCGKAPTEHASEKWLVNGKETVPSAMTVNCASNAE